MSLNPHLYVAAAACVSHSLSKCAVIALFELCYHSYKSFLLLFVYVFSCQSASVNKRLCKHCHQDVGNRKQTACSLYH